MTENLSQGQALLSVRNLSIRIPTPQGTVVAVEEVSFDLTADQTLGMVGESGSGKSVILRAILGLLPRTADVSGSIQFRGKELLGSGDLPYRAVRGREIAMIFQDPMSALNPIRRVGSQMIEPAAMHFELNRRESEKLAITLLGDVGIRNPEDVAKKFPHQLSGGMRQRVLIAGALACQPTILLCDEPTTALDVTVQKQILDLLRNAVHELGTSLIFVSHDLAVVDQICGDVQVMYAGQVVEKGNIVDVFSDPRHPYTAALLGSLPRVTGPVERPVSIPGELPDRFERPAGCRFCKRCQVRGHQCPDERYELRPVPGNPSQLTSCFYDLGIPGTGEVIAADAGSGLTLAGSER